MKKQTMDNFWIPGVNALGSFGRWAFAEFGASYKFESELDRLITGDLAGQLPEGDR